MRNTHPLSGWLRSLLGPGGHRGAGEDDGRKAADPPAHRQGRGRDRGQGPAGAIIGTALLLLVVVVVVVVSRWWWRLLLRRLRLRWQPWS